MTEVSKERQTRVNKKSGPVPGPMRRFRTRGLENSKEPTSGE